MCGRKARGEDVADPRNSTNPKKREKSSDNGRKQKNMEQERWSM